MRSGNRICIAGIDNSNQCIRPVTEAREECIPKDWLYLGKQLIIRPGAKVEFDFHDITIEPPHVEDRGFDPNHIIGNDFCNSTEWDNVLRKSSYNSVNDGYDGLLQEHKWVRPGANTKSLVTLTKPYIYGIELSESSVKPRLKFKDTTGYLFDCAVSDLTLWDMCYAAVKRQKQDRDELSREIIKLLKNTDRIYLRLGLARPWKTPELNDLRCYLQITGIYTFPDYLEGKSFPDF